MDGTRTVGEFKLDGELVHRNLVHPVRKGIVRNLRNRNLLRYRLAIVILHNFRLPYVFYALGRAANNKIKFVRVKIRTGGDVTLRPFYAFCHRRKTDSRNGERNSDGLSFQ